MIDGLKFLLYLCFFMGLGFLVGYSYGEYQTAKDIDPEACVSVCAEEFERFGC